MGDALDPATQVGPAAHAEQYAQNMRYLEIAAEQGGRLAAGGEALTLAHPGYYMSPALIADTDPEMRINLEEVFGPVVSTVRVKNFEAALEPPIRASSGFRQVSSPLRSSMRAISAARCVQAW